MIEIQNAKPVIEPAIVRVIIFVPCATLQPLFKPGITNTQKRGSKLAV